MVAGVLMAHFYSDGLFPASHAAWSWGCTYYTGGDMTARVDMAVNATDGPTCADGAKLECSCPKSPCEGVAAALPSNLACAGAGDDAGTSGCMKLHHTYGTPYHGAVAGQGAADQITTACGAADVIKLYGNAGGLGLLNSWGMFTDVSDNSTSPANAAECQALCAGNAECKFFTFNDQSGTDANYGYFYGLCLLHKELTCNGTAYSTFHGAISGPGVCPSAATAGDTGATPAPTPDATTDTALKDIVDTAVGAGSFTVLAAALTQASLVDTLKGTGPFTVFAPTDDAFAAALSALSLTKEELLAKTDLSAILTYHVVSGSVKSTDLSNGMTAATVNGADVTITIDGTTVKVNEATVTSADVMCSNGVIHIIDKVLLPPAAGGGETSAPPTATGTTTVGAGADADSAQTAQRLLSLTVGGSILSVMLLA